MRKPLVIAVTAVALLAACSRSDDKADGNGNGGGGPVTPPADLVLKAETALPPGQSGFFSLAGQVQGLLTGNPGDYGAHVDDQRLMYWSFDAKPGLLGTRPGTPLVPREGVEIYRDSYGVPIIHAANVRDGWYGVGYAIAQDRLFLMDAVRRMGVGNFAELTGCGGVPADIQQRTVTYTDAEYQAMFEAGSQDSKDAVLGYVDGANAWRAQVLANPTLLPAEYALLTTIPAPFTVRDVLAAGVYITRFVAAEGGNEFLNIQMLKQLEAAYGSREEAYKAFQDMTWLEDPKAITSVPRASGSFSNQAEPAAGREAVFRQMADWALTLPDTLWKGPGSGHAATPFPCTLPIAPPSLPAGLGAAGEVVYPKGKGSKAGAAPRYAAPSAALLGVNGPGNKATKERAAAARAATRKVIEALGELRAHLHGGSMAYALAPSRTRDRGTLMVSGPQLGYSYPLLLVEFELHAGDYHSRGSSVPLLPAVGIGYSEHAAWGLTTGYSKTIDSFIETICSTAQQAANTCAADQYFHNGQWKDMDCRDESIRYRAATQGIPAGPAILSVPARICRSVHGPIVARDDAAGLARSVQYAMFQREIETIEGVTAWSKAKTFAEFKAATAKVTWNENVTVATRDGHIAYFHPGLFLRRSPDSDMRLPSPGTGAYDFGAPLAFGELPQVVDPPQGYVGNWNNKPAFGWLDGEGLGSTSRPGGAGGRVTSVLDKLASRSDWSFQDLRGIDRHHGIRDHRAREYLPLLRSFRSTAAAQLSEVQKAALDQVLAWNGDAFGPTQDVESAETRDGVPQTLFGEIVIGLRDELFGELREHVIDSGVPDPDPNNPDAGAGLTVYGRVAGVGSHVYDQSVMDNLVLRILKPESSGLALRRDYTANRGRDAVMLAALNRAMSALAAQYNSGTPLTVADLGKCLRIHPRSQLCSLSGVIGPGSDTIPGTSCVTMPYEDRGSWVHRVGYEKP
ncbi:penicillin acylase family protein [Solimonas sp. K1W22B-7]|uniref:penicillin acylase family protein n=1 Tax=Solimonas sp. K1W22B-7 TaxID=2303331 RepID=UPI000E333D46|nr:penicillin acylase family protein [Solimonas sp. K1W22B-7]AXQ27809.1 penicillin acylase family protein [Solimonas sp. K1W22B-7]